MFREENRVLTAIVTFTFVGILFSSNVFIQPVAGKKCPGKCISNITQCKAAGGKIAGYCTNQLACCDCKEHVLTTHKFKFVNVNILLILSFHCYYFKILTGKKEPAAQK